MESRTSHHWRFTGSGEWPWLRDGSGPWRIGIKWRESGGRFECVGFSIEESDDVDPSEPPNIVTAQMLRAIPIGSLIKQARRREANESETIAEFLWDSGDWADTEAEEERLHAAAEAARDEGRRFKVEATSTSGGRRPMYDREHYHKVANIYYAAWRKGDPPTQAVAKHFTVSYSTAARWVRECRRRTVLSTTERGVAGGLPRWIDSEQEVAMYKEDK